MRIAMVTNVDSTFEDIGKLVLPNRRAYAKKHGYECVVRNLPGGGWAKIDALLDMWYKFDWIWWLDADAIITNDIISLDRFISPADMYPRKSLLVTSDCNGLNTGSMIVRSDCVDIHQLMADVKHKKDHYDPSMYEQTALAYLMWQDNVHDKVAVFPQRALNSYPQHPYAYELGKNAVWKPGDFVMHCPGLSATEKYTALSTGLGMI